MSQIGTLSVGILGDLSGLKRAFDDAVKGTKEFAQKTQDLGKEVSTAGKNLSLYVSGPIAAAGTAVIAIANNVGNFADSLKVQSAQTGISMGVLQEWRYVASQVGISGDAVVNAISGLSRRMTELASDTGAGKDALTKLGLRFDDIKNQAPEKVFDLLLQRLSAIPNVLERNSVASKVLGLGWKEIAPIITEGADSIEKLRMRAHELGLVIEDEAIEQADAMGDAWADVTQQLVAAKNKLGIELAPLMRDTIVPLIQNTVVPALKDFGDKVKGLVEWFTSLSQTMQENILKFVALVAVLGPAVLIVGKLITAVGLLQKALIALSAHPIVLIITALTALTAAWASAQQGLDSFGDYWNEFWIDARNSAISIYNAIGDAFAWTLNKLSDGLKWITAGLVDLGNFTFDGLPLVASLERIPETIYGINDAADEMIIRFADLSRATANDAIQSLVDNLEHLKYSLENVPQVTAMKKWQEESQKLADLWKKIYPELSAEIDAALSGAAVEKFTNTMTVETPKIKNQLTGITSAFDLGTEAFKKYQEMQLLIEEGFRNLPGVDYATTFHGVLGKLIGDFSDEWALLQVLQPGTLDYANALQRVGTVTEKAAVYQKLLNEGTDEQRAAAAAILPILDEMVRMYNAVSAAPVPTRLQEITKAIDDQITAMQTAGRGTIEYTNGLATLNTILAQLKEYEAQGVTGLGELIAKLQAAIGPTNAIQVALAALSAQAKVTAEEFLTTLSSNIASAITTFGEGLMTMGETNAQLAEDHKATLEQIDTDYQTAATSAADARDKDLQSLKDQLADGKITQETYTREMRQVWADYNKDFAKAEQERETALDDEKKAYEEQNVTIGKLVSDLVHTVLTGIARTLLGYAAEHAALALINALLLNPVQAAKEAAAAVAAGVAAAGVAILNSAIPAGFAKGGMVAGALGEPVPAIVHGGELVLTPEQQRAGLIDYEMMSAAMADALEEVLPGKDRPLYLVTDGKVWARTMLPFLQGEEKRLGLVTP